MNGKKLLLVAAAIAVGFIWFGIIRDGNNAVAESRAALAKYDGPEGWQYSVNEDEMRGTSTRQARVRADGLANLQPDLVMVILEDGTKAVGLEGSYERGAAMMRCRDTVAVKFDDGPVEDIGCRMGLPVILDPAMFDRIAESDVVWIETWTNLEMKEQFRFVTAGLNPELTE